MPCLRIFTSIAKDKFPADFVNKIVPLLAKTLDKPIDTFAVVVSSDCLVQFYGQSGTAPSVVATLESIGHLGVEENKVITREVTAFMQKELGIPPDQFFLSFYDLKGHNIGKGGVTHG